MIGNVRRAHGTEQDCIVVANLVEAVQRHHGTRAPEAIRAPIERVERKPEAAIGLGQRQQHFDSGWHYLSPHAVTRDGGDSIGAPIWGH